MADDLGPDSGYMDRVKRGIKLRQAFLRKAPVYFRFYRGKHWPDGMEDTHSAPVINYFFSAVETLLAHLSATRPRPKVKPRNPEDAQAAGVRSKLIDYHWEKEGCSRTVSLSVKDSLTVGVGLDYVGWNRAKNSMEFVYVDPLHFVIDPLATTLKDARWMAHVENVYLDELKERFEDDPAAKRLLDDLAYRSVYIEDGLLDVALETGMPSRAEVFFTNAGPYGIPSRPIQRNKPDVREDRVTYTMFWERRKDGWYLIQLANDIMLKEEKNPFAIGEFDEAPYIALRCFPDGRSFWSPGLGHQLEGIQIAIDLREQAILDILRFCAAPGLLIPTESGLKHRTLKVSPGMKIPYNYPFKPEWLVAPLQSIAPLFNTQQADIQRMQDIVGMVHVMKGATPPNVEAGIAIERLASLANARVQLTAGWLADDMRDIGRQMLARIEKFMTQEAKVRITQEGGQEEYVDINTDLDNQMGGGEFDVVVEQSPSLPTERLEKLQVVIQLYQLGLVDDIEVLRLSGLDNWTEIIGRRRQAQQELVQAQQAQQAQQAPPGEEMGESLPANMLPEQEMRMRRFVEG